MQVKVATHTALGQAHMACYTHTYAPTQRMSARTDTSGRSLGGTLSSNPVLAHEAGLHSALEVGGACVYVRT